MDVKQKLDYASAEFLKEKVVRFLNQQDIKIHLAVIRGEEINSIDYTVAMVSVFSKLAQLGNLIKISYNRILSRCKEILRHSTVI